MKNVREKEYFIVVELGFIVVIFCLVLNYVGDSIILRIGEKERFFFVGFIFDLSGFFFF